MKTLYLECNSGISGDMTVAALLDLGADEQVLRQAISSLPMEGVEIQITRVIKSGLDACDFNVILSEEYENHDHDMEYLHGSGHHNHDDEERHGHGHSHEAEYRHESGHRHHHRGMKEIREMIEASTLSPGIKKTALAIFTILGTAEAAAHGTTLEQVHFHEVGAVDSIVDIVAAAVCLDNLEIEKVIIPELWEGRGTIRCQHGVLPIPVPAVVNIVAASGLKLHMSGIQGELITPTGAAIAAAVRTSEELPEVFSISRVGLGAGKRRYDGSGILRAMLIEADDENKGKKDQIYKLESNIDDCTGEALGYAIDCLFKAGARDVTYTPIYMKKNRPAYQLNVICEEKDVSKLETIIFTETTTIGIRKMKMERTILMRESRIISTSLGEASAKVCTLPGGHGERFYPEYDSVVRLCEMNRVPFQDVYRLIMEECDG